MKTVAIEGDCDVLVCDKYDKYTISDKMYRPMILVSRNIKYNIRGGSIGEGASPSSTIQYA